MTITAPENTPEIVPPLPGAVVSDWQQWERTVPVYETARRFQLYVRIGGDGADDEPIGVTVSGVQATDGELSDIGMHILAERNHLTLPAATLRQRLSGEKD